jgi:voltage-gated sodium channel
VITRARLRAVVEHPSVQRFVITVIVLNAVVLALETSPAVMDRVGPLLLTLDTAALSIFVVELGLKLIAHGWRFWRDPWNVFDFIVVGLALVPAAGPFAVLRALRVLRLLRLITIVPSMRRVVGALMRALPGMASAAAVLALLMFVGAVMATNLFRDIAPEHFGDLGTSLFSLFQVMTLEAWPVMAHAVMAEAPAAWIFFVVYILVSSLAMLNLFIGVVVNAMEEQMREERAGESEQTDSAAILAELRALRGEVAALNGGNRGG